MNAPRQDNTATGALDVATILAPLLLNSMAVVSFCRATASDAILYGLLQLAFFFLPGWVLGQLLLRLNLRPLETMVLGYPLAHCIFFPLLWAGALFHMPYLPFALPVACAALALRLARTTAPAAGAPVISKQMFFILCAGGLVALLGFSLDMRPPVGDETIFVYKDYELATGKLFSIFRFIEGLPMTDFRIEGYTSAYHILQMLPQAYFAWLTGISPYTVAFLLDPQYTWVMTCGAALVGAKLFAGLDDRASAWIAAFLFFCAGLAYMGYQNFQLLAAPLTYPFSFPFFLLFVFYVMGYLSERIPTINPVYVAGLYLAAAGSKSTLGILLPLALAPVFLLRLVQRRITRRHWALLGLMVLAVILLKSTMFPSTAQAQIRSKGWAETVLDIHETLIQMFIVPETLYILVLLYLERPLRARFAGMRHYLLFALSFMLICALIGGTFDLVGGAEYFLWYPRCILLVFMGVAVAYAFEKRRRAASIIGAGLLVLGVAQTPHFLSLKTYGALFGHSINQTMADEPTAKLDANEWNALLWASKNIPHKELMFSNRMSCVYQYKREGKIVTAREPFYSYAAFSGMQSWTHDTNNMWIENAQERDRKLALIQRFLESNDTQEQVSLLKQIPCNYFLQCTRFNDKSYSHIPALKQIYANTSIIIYKIEHASQEEK